MDCGSGSSPIGSPAGTATGTTRHRCSRITGSARTSRVSSSAVPYRASTSSASGTRRSRSTSTRAAPVWSSAEVVPRLSGCDQGSRRSQGAWSSSTSSRSTTPNSTPRCSHAASRISSRAVSRSVVRSSAPCRPPSRRVPRAFASRLPAAWVVRTWVAVSGTSRVASPSTHCEPTSTSVRRQPRPPSARSGSRCGCTRATSWLVPRQQARPSQRRDSLRAGPRSAPAASR